MSVQKGTELGYDKSLTITEQIAECRKTLARYLENGRDGTSVVEAVRQRIADLEGHQKTHVATQERAKADLARDGATNAGGVIAPYYGKSDSIE